MDAELGAGANHSEKRWPMAKKVGIARLGPWELGYHGDLPK